jgi:hypothetical protein
MSLNEELVKRIVALEKRLSELEAREISAYAALSAENRLGMAQDRVIRGQDARFTTPLEDFTGTVLPSGWSWAGSPFVTPNTVSKFYGSHLKVQQSSGTPSRCFLVTNLPIPTSPTLYGLGVIGNHGFYTGLRLDDGSDNNYVEFVCMAETSTWLRSYATRIRASGGTVSTTYLYQNQPVFFDSIYAVITGTRWSNWGATANAMVGYFHYDFFGSVYPAGLSWTPTRYGIVFNFTEDWDYATIDGIS